MVDAAWNWARARNLWRVNPIHKEEEIKVVVDDFSTTIMRLASKLTSVPPWKWRTLRLFKLGGYMCPPRPLFFVHFPNHLVPKPCCQDPEGALLEESDLIAEGMSRLIPEVKETDDKSAEEAQPGTGASFKLPCEIYIYLIYIM